MAEEGQEEGEAKGGGLVRLLILVIPPLLLGLGGGFWYGQKQAQTAYEEQKKAEPEAQPLPKETSSVVGPVVKLEPFVVNLNEKRGNRYLKATIQLEMESEGVEEEVKKREPQVRDVILALLTSKSAQELQALEGKFRLREELQARINALLVNGKVRRVYFTDFVIQ